MKPFDSPSRIRALTTTLAALLAGAASTPAAPFLYTLTNTGNVTLQGVAVQDPAAASPVTCTVSVLPPGASTTCCPIDHPIGDGDLIASPAPTAAL